MVGTGISWCYLALPGLHDGIVPALMSDHMPRQVWDMSIWASSLTDRSAGTRKDKLEKGLLAMQELDQQPGRGWRTTKGAHPRLPSPPGSPKVQVM